MDEMKLPPELESYATGAVAEGRYRDRAEVVAAGVALLQKRDVARAAFLTSMLATEEEADRNGCVSGDEMLAPMARDLGPLLAAIAVAEDLDAS